MSEVVKPVWTCLHSSHTKTLKHIITCKVYHAVVCQTIWISFTELPFQNTDSHYFKEIYYMV